jgi:chromosome segregation ATPase
MKNYDTLGESALNNQSITGGSALLDQEPSELQLLTMQLMKAAQKNKELQQELDAARQEISRGKGSVEKLTHFIKEQEKKLTDLQHLNYTSKKSQEQKWEIEKQLEEKLGENQKLQIALQENKQQMEQLERVIQFLRERSEEFSLEAKQVKEDYQGALASLIQLREQNDQLATSSTDQTSILKRTAEEKTELEEELRLVQKQLENLKVTLQESQSLTEGQKFLIEENQQLKQQLEEQTTAWNQTQHEIHTIKQTLIRTVKDSKKLEIQFQEVLNERISLSNRAAQLQNLLDLQIEQTRLCQEQLLESQQRETRSKMEYEQQIQQLHNEHRYTSESLTAQLAELEEKNGDLSRKWQETELDLLQGREHAISQLTAEYEKAISAINEELHRTKQEVNELRADYTQSTHSREELKMEIQHLSHQLNTAQSDANEKENELRISQQHLAKKVKEVTLLQDKIDVQQQRVEELSRSLAAAEQKAIDLEKVVSDEHNRSRLFHEQMAEAVRGSEQKAAKLEEKYMDLHQKWAATEARNRELEKLADRHLQLQAQMQQFFGGFAPLPQQTQSLVVPETSVGAFAEEEVERPRESEAPIPFQNLLQPIRGNGRIKSNLFD